MGVDEENLQEVMDVKMIMEIFHYTPPTVRTYYLQVAIMVHNMLCFGKSERM